MVCGSFDVLIFSPFEDKSLKSLPGLRGLLGVTVVKKSI